MKNIIFALITLASANSFADLFNPNLKGYVVPADISVSFYENLMPGIGPIPDDRRVFFVKAIVEFCHTVNPLKFEIRAQEMATGGYALQLVATDLLVDCFGPTHKQELTYSLPMGVDKNGPFYNAQPIVVQDLGPVF